ncbi:MAG: hypothetical protein JSU73_13270 [candidate division WOR-3 bacterium]|nr:MAG: hypothetical protein JSU73_13270 [candidate division WOR-3 bacterium]
MRIVINHVTRMRPGFVCAAGVDTERMVHVRPVFRRGQLRRWLVDEPGAPFNMGCLADIGDARVRHRPPAVEDAVFQRRNAHKLGDVPAGHFWKMLVAISQSSLHDIFGHGLQPQGETYAVRRRGGAASLGCLVPYEVRSPEFQHFERDGRSRLRLSMFVSDGSVAGWLPVTDLRLYEPDQQTPLRLVIERVGQRIEAGVRTVLSVGLTRPLHGGMHWLQVNNIHLEDDPTWQVDVRPVGWLRRALRRIV